MRPDEKLAKKLEKELKIKIIETRKESGFQKKEQPSGHLTLGDVVVVRVEK